MFAFKKEDILNRSKNISLKLALRRKIWLGVLGVFSLILAVCLIISYNTPNACGVILNGKMVAVAESEEVIKQAIDSLQPGFAEVHYLEKIEFKDVRVNPKTLLGFKEVQNILSDKLTWTVEAAVISLNGKEVAILENTKVANQVLDEVKQVYLPKNKDSVEKVEVTFDDRLDILTREVFVTQLVSAEQAKELLLGTQAGTESYTVQEGDNLWTIARANDMRVADLMGSNPELTSEKLSIGQVLVLNKAEPLLNVTTSYQQQVVEEIAFETKTINDRNLARGQNKVKQPGKNGEKQVEYQVVLHNGSQVSKDKLSEKVIKEPVEKVVMRGTKLVLAARGSGGSGQLAWPLRGSITSSFGYRGREFHTGMDIDGKTGDPVRAAESGKVTSACWSGGYGYMVTINHGDGVVTRYAHNSKLKVKVGDKVARGEAIALVGSTGRSTGSHLHFEVLINGKFKNPRLYLK